MKKDLTHNDSTNLNATLSLPWTERHKPALEEVHRPPKSCARPDLQWTALCICSLLKQVTHIKKIFSTGVACECNLMQLSRAQYPQLCQVFQRIQHPSPPELWSLLETWNCLYTNTPPSGQTALAHTDIRATQQSFTKLFQTKTSFLVVMENSLSQIKQHMENPQHCMFS